MFWNKMQTKTDACVFLPPPSWEGIVVYVNHRALSSILGLELPSKTETEGRDGEGRPLCYTAGILCGWEHKA